MADQCQLETTKYRVGGEAWPWGRDFVLSPASQLSPLVPSALWRPLLQGLSLIVPPVGPSRHFTTGGASRLALAPPGTVLQSHTWTWHLRLSTTFSLYGMQVGTKPLEQLFYSYLVMLTHQDAFFSNCFEE